MKKGLDEQASIRQMVLQHMGITRSSYPKWEEVILQSAAFYDIDNSGCADWISISHSQFIYLNFIRQRLLIC